MAIARHRADNVLLTQRILLSGIIAAHGWARWLSGAIDPFGTGSML